jgi:predicted nuclease of predicted toxin-antitoxin system
MKFLTDQDVYAQTVSLIRNLGHDVVTASEIGMSRATDSALLARATSDTRLFVTRDKDFGGLVFVSRSGKGVILLRITPSTVQASHAELQNVLARYKESELLEAFVVIEPGQHRFRRLQ